MIARARCPLQSLLRCYQHSCSQIAAALNTLQTAHSLTAVVVVPRPCTRAEMYLAKGGQSDKKGDLTPIRCYG